MSSRSSENKSSSSKNEPFKMSDGDWICSDLDCGNINFARRTHCNLCGREKDPLFAGKSHSSGINSESQKANKKLLGHEIGKAAAEKSRGLFSADDWQCNRCGNVNWARRQTCNMCNAPKFGDNEERTGLGGGYNDREKVEYVDRKDSDDEWDDFGRKKKRRNRIDEDDRASSSRSKNNPKYSTRNEQSDDDEEDDEDLSKYRLDEEDGENEGNLDKYDLTSILNDKKEENNVKSSDKKRSSSRSPKYTSKRKSRSKSPKHHHHHHHHHHRDRDRDRQRKRDSSRSRSRSRSKSRKTSTRERRNGRRSSSPFSSSHRKYSRSPNRRKYESSRSHSRF